MTTAGVVRCIAYTTWAAVAVYIGSVHTDIGEFCAVVLIGAGVALGEAWASNPRHPNRAAAIATVIIVCTIALRCTAKLLSWDTGAVDGETTHEFVERHAAKVDLR